MKAKFIVLISALFLMSGCNKNNSADDQLESIPKTTVVNADIKEDIVAQSKGNDVKSSADKSADSAQQKNEDFVFSGNTISSSLDSRRYVKVGENLPISNLKKRFSGYKVSATAGEDCLYCATVSSQSASFSVNYDEKGVVVTSISCSNSHCTDALGNRVGSSLKSALRGSGNCEVGDWITCKSPVIDGLEYYVEYTEKCAFSPQGYVSEIPSCSRIAGFQIMIEGMYSTEAD